MASLQASSSLISTKFNVNAAISVPKLPKIRFSKPISPIKVLGLEKLLVPVEKIVETRKTEEVESMEFKYRAQMYVVLEEVCDRIEMHHNIKEQRDNWNKLLLNSINMMTLTATTMSGFAAVCGGDGGSFLGLKLSSTILFSGSMGMMVLMNKIQPSQLAEEQRNAERLFKQLKTEIETKIALNVLSQPDVEEAIEKVLAVDKAYPLPLLGDKMIEKFPKSFKHAVWWPEKKNRVGEQRQKQSNKEKETVTEMRDIVNVLRTKDGEDYDRLGNLVLKTNKILAVSGPLLSAIAASCSVFIGSCTAAGAVAAVAGSLATVVNSLEHGGQVGMAVEMYRNCGGFFKLLEELIESNETVTETEKTEDAESFEIKVALKLGRSLSELRDLARKARYSSVEGTPVQEFASKLF